MSNRYVYIPIVLSLFVGLSACVSKNSTPAPVVEAGVVTALDWEFIDNKGLVLEGAWEVVWGQLVSPAEFDAVYGGEYFSIPGRWNVHKNSLPNPAIKGSYGVATFRAKLKLPQYNRDLSFSLISPHGAWRLYVDDVLVGGNGVVSKDPKIFKANYISRILPAEDGDSVVLLQVANFSHAYGGPGHAIVLWDADNLRKTIDSLSLYYVFTLGVLFAIGLFHLIFYLADRKHDENGPVHLWFSFLCLMIMFRISGVIPYFQIYYPGSWYWSSLYVSYLSLSLSPAIYLLFFNAVFENTFPQKLTKVIIWVSILSTTFIIVTPESIFTHSRDFLILLNIFVIFYSLIFTIKAVRKKQAGAIAILMSNLVFFLTALNDASIYMSDISTFDLTPFGILFLGGGYSYALLLRLQRSFHHARDTSIRLDKLNVSLEKQVHSRTKSFEAAASSAQNSAQERAQFIAAASHDLRQPLHALSMFNLALKRKMQKQYAGKFLDLIGKQETSIRNLSDLLQDTLDTANMGITDKVPVLTSLTPKILLNDLANTFRARAKSKNIVIVVDVDEGVFMSDKSMLKRTLSNLIDNAVKAARTQVKIIGRAEKTNWIFSVFDDGQGIEQDDVDSIFAPYVSSEDNPGPQGGYGLGLYVVHEFTQALGGKINIISSTGEGSEFTLSLPKSEAPETALHIANISKSGDDEHLAGFMVLAIDDELDVLDAMRSILAEWQCRVQTAGNKEQAAALIEAGFMPDLMIVDYHLHNENGLALIADLREHFGATIPALIITGATETRILKDIKAAGLSYLLKPVDPTVLFNALRTHYNRSH